jgi:hemerythrin
MIYRIHCLWRICPRSCLDLLQLIDLSNKLWEKRKNKEETVRFRYSVAFLVMYAYHHFTLEEMYMESTIH